MPLTTGTTLGPYEILSPIGEGGMGEVYKARDTRLDRTVAIKVLPEHVASDPNLKQRFAREAKTISSLNHPHICTSGLRPVPVARHGLPLARPSRVPCHATTPVRGGSGMQGWHSAEPTLGGSPAGAVSEKHRWCVGTSP